jgi:ABC-2 type transport system permease protein
MNATIARLTWSSLLGRRRALLLFALPVIMIALAVVHRLVQGESPGAGAGLLTAIALGFLVPLLCLITGTGSIGPEIDDGSIIYILSKPISRYTIVLSKLLSAIVVVTLFSALPTLVAGLITAGTQDRVALAYAIGALVAGLAYVTLFLLLAVISRNAVIIGLLYALLWETVVGGYVPGAQALSIQQWSLAVIQKILGADAKPLGVDAAVSLPVAVVLLLVVIVGGALLAGHQLRSIRLTSEE